MEAQLLRHRNGNVPAGLPSLCIRFPGRNGLQYRQIIRIGIVEYPVQLITLRYTARTDPVASVCTARAQRLHAGAEIHALRIRQNAVLPIRAVHILVRVVPQLVILKVIALRHIGSRITLQLPVLFDLSVRQLIYREPREIILIACENIEEMSLSVLHVIAVHAVIVVREAFRSPDAVFIRQNNLDRTGRIAILLRRFVLFRFHPDLHRQPIIIDICPQRVLLFTHDRDDDILRCLRVFRLHRIGIGLKIEAHLLLPQGIAAETRRVEDHMEPRIIERPGAFVYRILPVQQRVDFLRQPLRVDISCGIVFLYLLPDAVFHHSSIQDNVFEPQLPTGCGVIVQPHISVIAVGAAVEIALVHIDRVESAVRPDHRILETVRELHIADFPTHIRCNLRRGIPQASADFDILTVLFRIGSVQGRCQRRIFRSLLIIQHGAGGTVVIADGGSLIPRHVSAEAADPHPGMQQLKRRNYIRPLFFLCLFLLPGGSGRAFFYFLFPLRKAVQGSTPAAGHFFTFRSRSASGLPAGAQEAS